MLWESCAEENATQEQLRLWNRCRGKRFVNRESITSGSDIATNRTYNYSRDETYYGERRWAIRLLKLTEETLNAMHLAAVKSLVPQVVSGSRRIAHAHAHESVLFYFLFTLSRGLVRAKWILDFAKNSKTIRLICVLFMHNQPFFGKSFVVYGHRLCGFKGNYLICICYIKS